VSNCPVWTVRRLGPNCLLNTSVLVPRCPDTSDPSKQCRSVSVQAYTTLKPWACVCVCVCLCLSQVGVLLKRLNVGSHKQHHTLRDSSFLKPKISAKFDRGHPLQRRQMQVWWVKIGDFRQITGYISKMVKDRHIVSIKVE